MFTHHSQCMLLIDSDVQYPTTALTPTAVRAVTSPSSYDVALLARDCSGRVSACGAGGMQEGGMQPHASITVVDAPCAVIHDDSHILLRLMGLGIQLIQVGSRV